MPLAAIHHRKPDRHGQAVWLLLLILLGILAITAGCASPAPPIPNPVAGDAVYIVAEGWHVEVGLPVNELKGPLAAYRDIFPGAAAVMFGYGKRSFMTGTAFDRVAGYVGGLFPGDSTIEVSAVNTLPDDAFGPSITTTLALPPGGAERVSNFIWRDLETDRTGAPRLIAVHSDRNSLLYGAKSQYDLDHTCNTWAVDALAAGGLPVKSTGVMLSQEAVDRARQVAQAQCKAPAASRLASVAHP